MKKPKLKEEETNQRAVRNTRKDLNRIVQSDTSSNDSHSQMFRVDSEELANLPDSHVLGAGGPTTRRAWQDWCKVSNNSNHDSQSEDEEGMLSIYLLYLRLIFSLEFIDRFIYIELF